MNRTRPMVDQTVIELVALADAVATTRQRVSDLEGICERLVSDVTAMELVLGCIRERDGALGTVILEDLLEESAR